MLVYVNKGYIDELEDTIKRKDRTLIECNNLLSHIELERDEDSCMGMAYVTSRISEDQYYSVLYAVEREVGKVG